MHKPDTTEERAVVGVEDASAVPINVIRMQGLFYSRLAQPDPSRSLLVRLGGIFVGLSFIAFSVFYAVFVFFPFFTAGEGELTFFDYTAVPAFFAILAAIMAIIGFRTLLAQIRSRRS